MTRGASRVRHRARPDHAAGVSGVTRGADLALPGIGLVLGCDQGVSAPGTGAFGIGGGAAGRGGGLPVGPCLLHLLNVR